MIYTRRQFGKLATAGMTAAVLSNSRILLGQEKPNSKISGVQIGVISYSYRQMDYTATGVLGYAVENGINAIELETVQEQWAGAPYDPIIPIIRGAGTSPNGIPPGMMIATETNKSGPMAGTRVVFTPEMIAAMAKFAKDLTAWRLSMPIKKYTELRDMYASKGVRIYAFKAAISSGMQDAECDYIFNAAAACGADQVTMEMPDGQPELTKRIGEFASKHKMRVGYHAHAQATPTTWDEALSQSPYNGINLDIGHYTAAGNHDALAFIEKHHDRITSMHMKDRKFPENGAQNVPWGQGDTPIAEALQLVKKNGYKFPCTIELEYAIPKDSDSVKEVQKCVDYSRKALA